MNKNQIFPLVGAPGSGKTWVGKQHEDEFDFNMPAALLKNNPEVLGNNGSDPQPEDSDTELE